MPCNYILMYICTLTDKDKMFMPKLSFAYINKILTGKTRITEKQKFSVIIYSVALVHFFLCFLFGFFKVYPLLIFNIISVITYLSSSLLIRKEHLWAVYCITYFEIILHSFVTALIIGWQFGFAQYIIGLIPVGYYICYTMNTSRHKMLIASLSSLLAMASYVSCKLLSYYTTPVYGSNVLSMELFIYLFNTVCTFIFVIVFSMIFIAEIKWSQTQLHHQNAILEKLASTDPLTGLYNRRSMDIFLNQAFETNAGFSLIMCDIDDFKKVNDTYGHDFGDIVLREVAHITTQQVKTNGYVCRWGGEELLILINGSAKERVAYIAENIRRNVANHIFELNNQWIHCTLTLGISTHTDGEPVEETITHADYNLYQGKRNGKNRVVA